MLLKKEWIENEFKKREQKNTAQEYDFLCFLNIHSNDVEGVINRIVIILIVVFKYEYIFLPSILNVTHLQYLLLIQKKDKYPTLNNKDEQKIYKNL